jgi:hypothetical protein
MTAKGTLLIVSDQLPTFKCFPWVFDGFMQV